MLRPTNEADMTPAAALMTEHRVIERMINLMRQELDRISRENKIDADFIDTAVDFLRTYADRCHHGKEEDILFRDLAKRKLSAEHKKIMEELIQEHVWGRKNVKGLAEAKDSYVNGNKDSFKEIIANMEKLIKFYPKHIEKEDKHFFLPCMEYFSKQEQDDMLAEFWEFDKILIHEKYQKLVEQLEK